MSNNADAAFLVLVVALMVIGAMSAVALWNDKRRNR